VVELHSTVLCARDKIVLPGVRGMNAVLLAADEVATAGLKTEGSVVAVGVIGGMRPEMGVGPCGGAGWSRTGWKRGEEDGLFFEGRHGLLVKRGLGRRAPQREWVSPPRIREGCGYCFHEQTLGCSWPEQIEGALLPGLCGEVVRQGGPARGGGLWRAPLGRYG